MGSKIDKDVMKMTQSQLRAEIMRLRTAFRKEVRARGNRRCWVNLLKALPEGVKIEPLCLSRQTFLRNCARYFDRNQ